MSVETAASLPPIAIAVAPNGGRRTKQDHPAIPITAQDLARDASECLEAGACMIHVHVRDAKGGHLLDGLAYKQAIEAIRSAVGDDLIVQITTEALGRYSPGEQIAVVKEVRPEAVSLAIRELAAGESGESDFAEFMLWLKQERIFPQIILYEPDEAVRLDRMRCRGLIPWESVPVLYVLGRYKKGQVSVPGDLLPFLAPAMPRFEHWSVCAFGRHEAACASAAALLGGHVRVGFENNLWLPGARIAPSNAALVTAVTQTMTSLGIKRQDASQLRTALEHCLAL